MNPELILDLPSLVSLSFGSCSFYFCYDVDIRSRFVVHCITGRLPSVAVHFLFLERICELQWKAREPVSSIPAGLAVPSLRQGILLELS